MITSNLEFCKSILVPFGFYKLRAPLSDHKDIKSLVKRQNFGYK